MSYVCLTLRKRSARHTYRAQHLFVRFSRKLRRGGLAVKGYMLSKLAHTYIRTAHAASLSQNLSCAFVDVATAVDQRNTPVACCRRWRRQLPGQGCTTGISSTRRRVGHSWQRFPSRTPRFLRRPSWITSSPSKPAWRYSRRPANITRFFFWYSPLVCFCRSWRRWHAPGARIVWPLPRLARRPCSLCGGRS